MLSERIYALRRRSGLSQEQLAERIGVSRQAISKWEGGLSVPELDKLKALSECFQVTLDELTENQLPGAPGGERGEVPAPGRRGESRAGVCLCLVGAVCLILFGVLTVAFPSAAGVLNESSVITLNGTGILIGLSAVLMLLGAVLMFWKK